MIDIIPTEVLWQIMLYCNGKSMRALGLVNKRAQAEYHAIRIDILKNRPVVWRRECVVRFNAWRKHWAQFNNDDRMYVAKRYVEGQRYAMWKSGRRAGGTTANAFYAANALCMDDDIAIVVSCCGKRATEKLIALVKIMTPPKYWSRKKLISAHDVSEIMNLTGPYRLVCEHWWFTDYRKCIYEHALSIRAKAGHTLNEKAGAFRMPGYVPPSERTSEIELFTCSTWDQCRDAINGDFTWID